MINSYSLFYTLIIFLYFYWFESRRIFCIDLHSVFIDDKPFLSRMTLLSNKNILKYPPWDVGKINPNYKSYGINYKYNCCIILNYS